MFGYRHVRIVFANSMRCINFLRSACNHFNTTVGKIARRLFDRQYWPPCRTADQRKAEPQYASFNPDAVDERRARGYRRPRAGNSLCGRDLDARLPPTANGHDIVKGDSATGWPLRSERSRCIIFERARRSRTARACSYGIRTPAWSWSTTAFDGV